MILAVLLVYISLGVWLHYGPPDWNWSTPGWYGYLVVGLLIGMLAGAFLRRR